MSYPDKTQDEITSDILDQVVEGKFLVSEAFTFTGTDTYAFTLNRTDAGVTTPVNEIVEVKGTVEGIYRTFTAADYQLYDANSDGVYESIRWLGTAVPDTGSTFSVSYRHTDVLKASGLTDRNVGSVLRTLVEAVGARLEDQYDLLKLNYESAFLGTAVGEALDDLVALVGITRVEASKAAGKLMFYTDVPVSSNLIISTGTTVQTTEGIQFQTTEDGIIYAGYDHTCESDGTEKGVETEAIVSGDEGNVGAGTITLFVGTPPSGVDSVDNPAVINGVQNVFSGGEDEETDEALRARAGYALVTAGRGTKEAIRGAVLAIPGVAEASVQDYTDDSIIPLGEAHVTVVGETVPIDEGSDTWADVLATVDSYRSAGVRPVVKQPWQRFVYLEGTSKTLENMGYDEDEVAIAVAAALEDFLRAHEVGNDLLWNSILHAALEVPGCRDFTISNLRVSDQTVTVGGAGSDYPVGTDANGKVAQSFVPGYRSVVEETHWENTGDANPDYVEVTTVGSSTVKSASGIFLLGDDGERSTIDPQNYSDGTFNNGTSPRRLYVDSTYDGDYSTGTPMRAEYQYYHVTAIRGVRLYLKRTGDGCGTVTVRVETDSSGSPSGTLVTGATGTITESAIGTTYSEHYVDFGADRTLTAGTKYWIVVYAATSGYLYIKAATSAGAYKDGEPKRYNGATWDTDMNPTLAGTQNYDIAFKTIEQFTGDVRIDAGVKPPQIAVLGRVTVTGSEVSED